MGSVDEDGKKIQSKSIKMAMAMGGRTTRPCDVCEDPSVRWYCVADEAYFCDFCDTSVHTANSVACRHKRVKTTPAVKPEYQPTNAPFGNSYRSQILSRSSQPYSDIKSTKLERKPTSLVNSLTKVMMEENEEDEDPIAQVPVFVPLAERRTPAVLTMSMENTPSNPKQKSGDGAMRMGTAAWGFEESPGTPCELEEEMELECLIGNQSADDQRVCLEFCMPTAITVSSHSYGTEFMDSCVPTENDMDFSNGSNSLVDDKRDTPLSFLCSGLRVKMEDTSVDVLEINNVKVEEADDVKMKVECFESNLSVGQEKEIRLMLRLNYQDVLAAWSNRGSLWADDNPIQTLLEADTPSSDGTENQLDYGVVPESESMGNGGQSKGPEQVSVILTSSVREARVIRYREKRRNRLFSKRIRYQVRKINAEKRPRMKGRFVKRSASSICLE